MYKKDLALNKQQWLICHKIQPTNQTLIFFCLWFNDIKYSYQILIIFKEIYLNGTQTVTITIILSAPGSNGNEGKLHIPRTGASPSDVV